MRVAAGVLLAFAVAWPIAVLADLGHLVGGTGGEDGGWRFLFAIGMFLAYGGVPALLAFALSMGLFAGSAARRERDAAPRHGERETIRGWGRPPRP